MSKKCRYTTAHSQNILQKYFTWVFVWWWVFGV